MPCFATYSTHATRTWNLIYFPTKFGFRPPQRIGHVVQKVLQQVDVAHRVLVVLRVNISPEFWDFQRAALAFFEVFTAIVQPNRHKEDTADADQLSKANGQKKDEAKYPRTRDNPAEKAKRVR